MSPDWADKPEAVPYSSLDDPQSLNLYGYVRNNPLSRADPDGHEDCCDALAAVGKEIYNQTVAPILNLTSGISKLPAHLMGQETSPAFHGELKPASESQAETMAAVAPAVTMATMITGEGEGTKVAGVVEKVGEAGEASKVFSAGKQALVDMAKTDKKLGMTSGDMQAYKDLNKTLPDPFPANKIRGPEAHSSGLPSSQQPHGHVGPVDHIPIKDKTP